MVPNIKEENVKGKTCLSVFSVYLTSSVHTHCWLDRYPYRDKILFHKHIDANTNNALYMKTYK